MQATPPHLPTTAVRHHARALLSSRWPEAGPKTGRTAAEQISFHILAIRCACRHPVCLRTQRSSRTSVRIAHFCTGWFPRIADAAGWQLGTERQDSRPARGDNWVGLTSATDSLGSANVRPCKGCICTPWSGMFEWATLRARCVKPVSNERWESRPARSEPSMLVEPGTRTRLEPCE